MTASVDLLASEVHAHILSTEIIPEKTLQKAAHQYPRAIILGGQPGAGKGGLVDVVRDEFAGDVVNIDPDELRNYHPRIQEFRATNPYTWSGRTQADAGQWADELREAAVAGRRNFIFDTTLSNGPWSAELIRDLQARGYEVEVRVVASPKLESELGVDQRYGRSLDRNGYGRHVPEGARDAIYDKLPASLDTIRAGTDAPIRIFDREGRELYDSRTDARAPGEVLSEARDARLHEPAVLRRLKDGWHQQQRWHQELPDSITHNRKVAGDAAQRLLTERNVEGVVEGVRRATAQADRLVSLDYATRVHPGVVKSLGVAGAATVVLEAGHTARRTADLLQQDNPTGAASAIEHFGSRNAGMLGGAALGAQVLGLAGIESGPLDIFVAGLGGAAGAVAGDKLADWHDQHKIHNQTDARGRTWHHDPQHPEKGWMREVPTGETGYSSDHPLVGYSVMPTPTWRTVQADPALAARLTFQANNTAVELVLAHPATPVAPYVQPAAAQDTASRVPAPWQRNAASGTWSRTVVDAVLEHGLSSTHVEVATPQRTTELEAAAQATLTANLAHSTRGIAERYEAIYEARGWQQYGAMPAAVTQALQAPTDVIEASDGRNYRRGTGGRWSTPGRLWGRNLAEGNLRAELDATAYLMDAARATGHPAATTAATPAAALSHADASATPTRPVPAHLRDFRHPDHPLHANYGAMLRHVHALEDRHRIPHGDHSERAAAALVDRQSIDRLGRTVRITLHGEGKSMAMHLVTNEPASRNTYLAVERGTPLSVFDAVARPVEAISRDWSRRELPHLHQARALEPEAPAHDPRALAACDPRRTDHPRHVQFETLRERIGAAYARYGVERSADQLDRASAAVMLDLQKHRASETLPNEVRLLPDPHTGRIGPASSVLTGDPQAFTPSTTITKAQAMQQEPEVAFRQLDQVAAQQAQAWAAQTQPSQAIAR